MNKVSLRSIFINLIFLFLLLVLLVLLTFPKFLLLERELAKAGLYLTAREVKEDIRGITLKEVNLYDKSSKLARFDSLRIDLRPFGVGISALCEGKGFWLDWSITSKRLKAQDFTCFSVAESISADLVIKEGLYGKMWLKGIRVQDTKVEELSLEMKGRVFTAKAKVMGFELVGDGQVVFNPSNFLESKINGRLSGGMNLTISGTLEKIQLTR